jgi:hypothetical protein
MPPGHERNVVYTYRYLRAAMIALLLMLVFSVAYQWWWETGRTCWLGSISAYYYTPARTIFVGSLCALGACLIAYKGHSAEEDILLNFSGFMAFVVVIVPTAPDDLCGLNAYSQTLPEIASAVRNNIWSLILVTALAAIVGGLLRRRSTGHDAVANPSPLTVVVWVACGVVVLGELALFLLLRPRFIAVSHGLAAITMVAGVIAVMVFSALRTEERHEGLRGEDRTRTSEVRSPRRYKAIYLLIAGVLLVTLVVTLLAAWMTSFDHLILWVELTVIVLFGAYWGVQTHELWNLRESAITAAVVPDLGPEELATHQRPLGEPSSTPRSHVLDYDVEGRKAQTVAE